MIRQLRSVCVRIARRVLPPSLLPRRRFDTAKVFQQIHDQNLWKSDESVSGPGSTMQYTEELRKSLPALIARLQVKSLLDLPCGDFRWMQTLSLPLDRFVGGDIVPALIEQNQKMYGDSIRQFRVLDLTADPLPSADMLLCRDCMIHLPLELIARALANICRSQIGYAVMTTYPKGQNVNIALGSFFQVDLQSEPFNLPPPTEELIDWIPPFPERVLGVWRVEDLRRQFAINPLELGSVFYNGAA
jgi:hypothetical protein